MASLAIWLEATRPKTLPAAISPVLIGTAVAYADGSFDWRPALLCLAFAGLVQIGTNFANDYLDGVKGADTEERLGPRRAVASGLISPRNMKWVALGVLALAFVIGLGLVPFGGIALIAIGLASVVCAWLYTGGPYPLAYNGLGDVFVILFFGLIAVTFSCYVQTREFSVYAILFGLSIGVLVNNLLVINNLRDFEEDTFSGKRTLVVIFGRKFARMQYLLSVVLVGVLTVSALPKFGMEVLFSLVPVVLGFRISRQLRDMQQPSEFLDALKHSGMIVAIYGVAFSLAVAL